MFFLGMDVLFDCVGVRVCVCVCDIIMYEIIL